ncbi:hypothetical protein LTR37_011114 [Vermiconidia calcicola]|uniref:Uncharacterized protein n=1 Tax=Vermiconidia calcicola TaxID=1690605 RepID=A0ACC3N363_9PEZI|nr:hypothetical protein LTR37_011114 [Vermiconidia calcicola]
MATSFAGDRMMLVYEHKTNGRKLVPNGLSIMDEEGIVMIMSGNPDICMVTKAIQPSVTSVDLYKIDLMSEDEKAAAVKVTGIEKPDDKEEVPWKVFFGHEWEGHSFNELVILYPETTIGQAKTAKTGNQENKLENIQISLLDYKAGKQS